jgi:hypothetical protein
MPRLNQVFGVSAQIPEYTYVDRSGLDNRFRYSLERNAHIVLHGGSKQGKTVLRKKNLAEDKSIVIQCRANTTCSGIYQEILAHLGVAVEKTLTNTSTTGMETAAKAGFNIFAARAEAGVTGTKENEAATVREPVGLSADNLRFVSNAILRSGARVVIEDFHYMPEEEKRTLSFDLKAFWDLRTFVIIVGVWAEQNLLAYYNGDLSGRTTRLTCNGAARNWNRCLQKENRH